MWQHLCGNLSEDSGCLAFQSRDQSGHLGVMSGWVFLNNLVPTKLFYENQVVSNSRLTFSELLTCGGALDERIWLCSQVLHCSGQVVFVIKTQNQALSLCSGTWLLFFMWLSWPAAGLGFFKKVSWCLVIFNQFSSTKYGRDALEHGECKSY